MSATTIFNRSRRSRLGRGLGRGLVLGLALAAGACANDPYADSIGLSPEERLMEAPGGMAAALARVARGTRNAGDYGSAINVYKRAHALEPNDIGIMIELGETLAAVGAYHEAREVLVRAAGFAPENARALRGLANTLVGLGEPQLALTRYHQALAVAQEASTFNGMAVALEMSGETAAAEAAWRTGLDLEPMNETLAANLGLSLALSGKTEEGIALIAPLVRQGSASARTRQNLALVYGLAGRGDDARAVLAIDLDARAIERNIAFYEMLRGMPEARRRQTVLGARRVIARTESAAVAAPPDS